MTRRLLMDVIVAADEVGGIGKAGTIPWAIRKDMAHFMKKTTGVKDPSKRNAVVMGRKCWESIPAKFRPLKGRLNVVVSRTMEESTSDDVIIRNDLDKLVDELAAMMDDGKIERIWNIGGGEIYAWALQRDLVHTIELTKIKAEFDADVKLPEIKWENFREVAVSDEHEEKDLKFTFHTYERV